VHSVPHANRQFEESRTFRIANLPRLLPGNLLRSECKLVKRVIRLADLGPLELNLTIESGKHFNTCANIFTNKTPV
jgi:hypothetical protein